MLDAQPYVLYGWALAPLICNFAAALCIALNRANSDCCFGNGAPNTNGEHDILSLFHAF